MDQRRGQESVKGVDEDDADLDEPQNNKFLC
jgi:hypothetical protein